MPAFYFSPGDGFSALTASGVHCARVGAFFKIGFDRTEQYYRFGLAGTPGLASKGGVEFRGKFQVQLLNPFAKYFITGGEPPHLGEDAPMKRENLAEIL